jgi:hypothetical protein
MPRLPRFLAAGLLLLTAAMVLGALLMPGPVAVVVFVALWYVVAVVNAGLGVMSAGYPLRSEIAAFVPVFGVPAAAAVVAGAVWAPVVSGPRIWFVWLAGLALWAAVWLLIRLLAPGLRAAAGPTALIFSPLWVLISVLNLVVGVRSAGYGLAEELPVLLASVAVPVGLAVVSWWVITSRRPISDSEVRGPDGRIGE